MMYRQSSSLRPLFLFCAILFSAHFSADAQSSPEQQKPKGPWTDKSLSPDRRAELLVRQMTFNEKISLVHGMGWGPLFSPRTDLPPRSLGGAAFVPGIPRLGVPDLQMADAAVGVTHGALFGRYSTALPSCVAEAASWDPDIAAAYGAVIGRELHDQGFNMSLGGGVNLTREPRDGRTFEYRGEDPILAGRMVAAEMKALRKEGVISDIKHFAMNDQENGRGYVNSRADRRAMRESDLLAFEIGIREGDIGAVMCSYNLVNGTYGCENKYLLTDLLKNEWGFRGFVVSDWGGTHSTVEAASAGLDMEMPTDKYFGAALKKAVDSRQVSEARLDDMVRRILRSEFAAGLFDNAPASEVPNVFQNLEMAQRIAAQGSVLLRNSNGLLPLSADRIRSIAVIGSHADVGVLSGGGSAQVDAAGGSAVPPPTLRPGEKPPVFGVAVWHRSSPLRAICARAPGAKVEYNPGTDPSAAAALAKSSDVAIVLVNQPESEASDLPSLALPDNQDALVQSVAEANPHTIVVLETGGPVTMPWIDRVGAVLETWYPGIRGGEAMAAILFGDVNPSGKLPVTFPRSEADLPHPAPFRQPEGTTADMKEMFPGFMENTRRFDVNYDEGLKVGYKWYDAEQRRPQFPFGYGLSYTTFAYSDIALESGPSPHVTFVVKNTGTRAGSEIAEVYATLPQAAAEPFQRLVAWGRVQLAPGESKTIRLALDRLYLSIFDVHKNAWELVPGEYGIHAGGSSRDLPLSGTLRIN